MKKIILVFVVGFCFNGCASIVSQSTWPVKIIKTQGEAKFIIINEKGETIDKGITPATVTLNSSSGYFKGASYHVMFSREGINDTYSFIDSTINGWYWGNILFGGIIGFLIIDPVSGAMWKLPEYIGPPQ